MPYPLIKMHPTADFSGNCLKSARALLRRNTQLIRCVLREFTIGALAATYGGAA